MIFPFPVCVGWLVVPDPGGVPPRASGAEGECQRWGDVNCEGQRGGSSFGDGHHSQTSAHKHAAWVHTVFDKHSHSYLIYAVMEREAFVSWCLRSFGKRVPLKKKWWIDPTHHFFSQTSLAKLSSGGLFDFFHDQLRSKVKTSFLAQKHSVPFPNLML